MRRFLLSSFLLFTSLFGLTVFEVSGERAFPAGTASVKLRGEAPDSSYSPGSWHTLHVGVRGRTDISTAWSWLSTKTQWEAPSQALIPLGEKMGWVETEDLQSGTDSIEAARRLAGAWADVPIEFTSARAHTPGGSGGLILALAFLDAATEGDLTGGLTVAGTGVLDPSSPHGYVNPVLGTEYKLESAEWVHADLIFVPYQGDTTDGTELDEEWTVISGMGFAEIEPDLRQDLLSVPGPLVIRVTSFSSAVEILKSFGGSCGSCSLPDKM